MKKKTLDQFEAVHGQEKVKDLRKRLATEQAKVDALAGVQNKVAIKKSESNTLKFALLGDIHVGSLYFRPEALQAFYDYAEKQGVQDFFITGDILSGHRVFKGHEFELRDIGLEAQAARLKECAPRNGFSRFITGNHDASFKHLVGVSVGKMIEQTVDTWEFLGEEQGRVRWETPEGDFELMLIHPGGGSSYALSYRPQKIVESLEGGTKPNMLAIGHYHKAEMMPSYRNVCSVQTGTFEAQTPFMARQGLAAHVGGWLMEVVVGKGYNTIRGEFVAFYNV